MSTGTMERLLSVSPTSVTKPSLFDYKKESSNDKGGGALTTLDGFCAELPKKNLSDESPFHQSWIC
jgi:hypothetical protein